MSLLVLEGITKRFGGLVAVSSFSLSVERGELVGIIGPNGAGKTTLFNLITAVYSPDEGDMRFEGVSLKGLKTHQVTRLGVARTFQNLRLLKRASALENVKAAAQLHHPYSFLESISHLGRFKAKESRIERESLEALEMVGLVDRAHQPAGTLPYGHQRRLEIARALALRPRLLLLDEPAAGMNPEEIEELNALILKIHRELGLTTVVIEHHMELVVGICQRVVCMNFGVKIAEGTPEEVCSNPEVIRAYLGEDFVGGMGLCPAPGARGEIGDA